jgi:hypothetical protein
MKALKLGLFFLLYAGILVWFFQPVLAWNFTPIFVQLIIFLAFVFVIHAEPNTPLNPTQKYASVGISFLGAYVVLMPFLTSWEGFHAEKYRNLIGEVKEASDFSKDVAPVSVEKIRIVDQEVAQRLGNKVLGENPSLGSQAELGEFHLQSVKGDLYWIAPLLHSGFFKWLDNLEGTPGYVMVSAVNERDVRLVQKSGDKPIRLKYQENAYGLTNLTRHVYLHGYMTNGLTDYTLEVDDVGKPYWVITLYKKKIGFDGEDAVGVLTVDVETGEINEYDIENAPEWIDRIQPKDFVVEQLDDWGEYVKGYINLSNEGKLTTSNGISLVYGNDGKSYWYTGLTSVGGDASTVGFVLVNTRNKETKWYRQVGATEEAAQTSAAGKVQEKGYIPSFPITYNINGIPTYVMSLKDRAGLVKMIAMVSVQDYSVVGVGNNLQETLRSYKNALNSTGNQNSIRSGSQQEREKSVEGKIVRIASEVNNGNTFYYFTLESMPDKIFIAGASISNELALTQAGDLVKVSFDMNQNRHFDVSGFSNKNFETLPKSESDTVTVSEPQSTGQN